MGYRYSKPPGYSTLFLINGNKGRTYKPWNGYVSGDNSYSPGRYSLSTTSMTFSAAPANNSQLTVQDGSVLKTFTFTYSGSPGPGIIPLVAGGGTAAQAANATQVALAAQLTYWTASISAPTVAVITSTVRGPVTGPGSVGSTNITFTTIVSTLGIPVPGRVGHRAVWLPVT